MIKVDENDPVGELEPTFPYRDVSIKRGVDMKEFYDLEGEIGRGKFGTVFKCREKGTNLTLAAKFVAIARRQDRRNVEREVEIMKTLQHPRLIQLYDAFETDNVMCVVLELIEGGELFERVIDDDFVLTEKACTVFMRQICEGVAFIHSNNIIHLDLKPENILCLTKTGNRIKIIDFGLARKFEPDKKLQVLFGTPEFVAPEVVNFDQISCATDMWSVGVICYVLLSGLSPFMGETDVETMANVTIARYDFEDDSFEEISPEAKDFVSRLLLKDKEARLTAVECLSHPWLRRQIPPPPPALDTTKDNLRNYVEKCLPIITSAKFIDKDLPTKPGLIENIIANEQKVINSHSIPVCEMKKIPVHPLFNESQPVQNILNPDKLIFSVGRKHGVNDNKNIISNNQDVQTIAKIEENNLKNNSFMPKISSDKSHTTPQTIFEKPVPVEQNLYKLTSNPSTFKVENNEKFTEHKPPEIVNNISSISSNEGKNEFNSKLNSPVVNAFSENDILKLGGADMTNEIMDNKIIPANTKISEKPVVLNTTISPGILKSKSHLSNAGFYKDPKKEQFLNNQTQIKCPEETNVFMSSNKQVPSPFIPTIVFPSISKPQGQNVSSDFSFITSKTNETFNKIYDRSSISNVMKCNDNKNVPKERIVSSSDSLEGQFTDAATSKDCDPHVFKQHLKATPPWFSELKNQNLKQTSGDRFDRRSSDFSCFLNSKEDSESLNLADEIRKLSARLLQMSNNQAIPPNPPVGTFNTSSIPIRSRNDPITCFLENHGIPPPRPKFKFSSMNRDVPIGSPPPPSNFSYYLNIESNKDKKDSRSAPESPRSSPEKSHASTKTSISSTSSTVNVKINKETSHILQEKASSMNNFENTQINKANKKLRFPV